MVSCFFFLPPAVVCVALMLPMIVDGIIQLKTAYESTNLRRLVTGFLFGYALFALFALSVIATFNFGYQLTQ